MKTGLLSLFAGVAMLTGVGFAQADQALSSTEMDQVTAGATFTFGNGTLLAAATGTTVQSNWNNGNPFSTAANGGTLAATANGCPAAGCSLTLP